MMMNMQRVTSRAGILLLALLVGAVSSTTTSSATAGAVRMQLRHADAGRGLTTGELLQRMALRSNTRAARFLSGSGSGGSSSSSASAPVTSGYSDSIGEYLVQFGIGTPSPQAVELVLDTGSDLIWTQCQPCISAGAGGTCFNQSLPYFDPSRSSTFVNLTCDSSACQALRPLSSCDAVDNNQTCVYNNYSYGDMSMTSGELVQDTFVFEAGGGGAAQVPNLSFGCGLNNSGSNFKRNETGIAGFGRGNLSLPSQLKVDNFSYCFTNITASTPSTVLLGLPPNLYGGNGGAAVQTTPLIRNPKVQTFYYLNLTSIRVGSTTLPVPASAFALNADGSGGTVIDSGTSITRLPLPIFSLLRDAFASQLNMTAVMNVTSLPGLPCFPATTTTTTVVPPTLQLQFDGATLDVPQDNYVYMLQEDDNSPSYMCIAILSSLPGPGLKDVTIIGNYQQQNMHVLYDLAGDTLSFVPAQCDML